MLPNSTKIVAGTCDDHRRTTTKLNEPRARYSACATQPATYCVWAVRRARPGADARRPAAARAARASRAPGPPRKCPHSSKGGL